MSAGVRPPPQPLLRHAADVTPEWLTGALRAAGLLDAGARVDGLEAAPIGTGQMADTTRFTLGYDEPGAGPRAVVGKFASADDQSRNTGLALRAYEIEVRFYREVAARIGARVPAVYVAEVEPETGWFTLLMEDITGARQGDQIEACGPDVAASVLDEMAGLHAPCWDATDLARLDWLNRASPDSSEFFAAMVASLLPGFLDRYADELAPEHQEVCRIFVDKMPVYLARHAGPRTATHGDFRLDNLLFQPENPRPVVVDWQTTTWAGASVDVAYFLGGCLSTEDRRAHQDDLLARYHEGLTRRGVRDYTMEQLRADVRLDTFHGVLMAIVASMIVQRTERGDLMFLTSTRRHAQHALDEDAPALLLAAP